MPKPTPRSSLNIYPKLIILFKKLSITYRVFTVLVAIAVGVVIFTYVGGKYYIVKHKNEPTKLGATFVPDYARYFGLNPKVTMDEMINDLGIRQFRLVSYWKNIESTKGTYDFSELDWQFKKAEESGSKVSLAVGLRQPRWPECHEPAWAKGRPIEQWRADLYRYIEATVNRYKDNPALESYQLENEYFMSVFGECTDFSRDRLVYEADLVKRLDPNHKLIISRSNNWGGIPLRQPTPDQFAVSIYKRVWDKTATKRYFEYPYPPWFYSSLGGYGELVSGKSMVIHELQTEAWLPKGYKMNQVNDIPEMTKSVDAERLDSRIQYGLDTGIKEIYLWGPEWWYWLKQNGHPELWDVAKTKINQVNALAEENVEYTGAERKVY